MGISCAVKKISWRNFFKNIEQRSAGFLHYLCGSGITRVYFRAQQIARVPSFISRVYLGCPSRWFPHEVTCPSVSTKYFQSSLRATFANKLRLTSNFGAVLTRKLPVSFRGCSAVTFAAVSMVFKKF